MNYEIQALDSACSSAYLKTIEKNEFVRRMLGTHVKQNLGLLKTKGNNDNLGHYSVFFENGIEKITEDELCDYQGQRLSEILITTDMLIKEIYKQEKLNGADLRTAHLKEKLKSEVKKYKGIGYPAVERCLEVESENDITTRFNSGDNENLANIDFSKEELSKGDVCQIFLPNKEKEYIYDLCNTLDLKIISDNEIDPLIPRHKNYTDIVNNELEKNKAMNKLSQEYDFTQ